MSKSPRSFTLRLCLTLLITTYLVFNPSANVRSAGTAGPYRVYLPGITRSLNQVEWTFHKTTDGLHPDGNEQQMLWLMNRARVNPPQEGRWLATTRESDISGGRDYFHVNVNLLQSEFNGYPVKPPAAFDARMFYGSKAHSEDLIARNAQDHNGQFERITNAGFHCGGGRASVFAYSGSALNAHGAFNIDWGGGADGMQTGRGHRMAIMDLDGDYTNVGIAMVPAPAGLSVGPLVTSAAYCHANESQSKHFNRFITGTVWQDRNGNSRYDPGEGFNNIKVTHDREGYFAITGVSGGYAIPVTKSGNYLLTFSGTVSGQVQVNIGSTSVLVDFLIPRTSELMSDLQPELPPTTEDLEAPLLPPAPGITFP